MKRPPIPAKVWVAWFWDPEAKGWFVDWTSRTKKDLVAQVCDGIFKHRHRYVEYRQPRKAAKR